MSATVGPTQPPATPPKHARLNPLYYLPVAVPVAVAAELLHWSPLAILATSALAILPLSALLGHATEQLAGHAGPTVGGLLNATLGYVLSLVYSMWTHRAAFTEGGDVARGEEPPEWSLRRTLLVLAAVAATIGVLSEFLVGATEEASRTLGLTDFFVGLVVVPIIGNAAEHSSAVRMAMKDRMDLAVNIAVGSCVQVALLVAPVLVFLGVAFGQPMTLAFSTFEVASVTLAVLIALAVIGDAESHWLEGALLLIVYAVLAVAFFLY